MTKRARWRVVRHRRWERIYELHAKGLSVHEIAVELRTSPLKVQKLMQAAQVRKTLQQIQAGIVQGDVE